MASSHMTLPVPGEPRPAQAQPMFVFQVSGAAMPPSALFHFVLCAKRWPESIHCVASTVSARYGLPGPDFSASGVF